MESQSKNYSNILYTYFSNIDSICHDKVKSHFMMYITSGEVIIIENGKEYKVSEGECIFVRRDHRIMFTKNRKDGKPYQSVTLEFNKSYLKKFYQGLNIDYKLKKAQPLRSSVHLLDKSPYLDSLFLSMIPFFESRIEPNPEFMSQKLEEGIKALLNLDNSFYPTLFDFADPWKIDILDFLEKNYMSELTIEEIATYTGRSLATFKRDFAKISDTTPQKWLIQKRLQKAYDLIKEEGKKVTDVYYDVGFKNRSHFSIAFKKQYGLSPTNI